LAYTLGADLGARAGGSAGRPLRQRLRPQRAAARVQPLARRLPTRPTARRRQGPRI